MSNHVLQKIYSPHGNWRAWKGTTISSSTRWGSVASQLTSHDILLETRWQCPADSRHHPYCVYGRWAWLMYLGTDISSMGDTVRCPRKRAWTGVGGAVWSFSALFQWNLGCGMMWDISNDSKCITLVDPLAQGSGLKPTMDFLRLTVTFQYIHESTRK